VTRNRKSVLMLMLAAMLAVPAAAHAKHGGAAMLRQANAKLEQMSARVRVYTAETITAAGSERQGQIIFAWDVGNKQLDAHFVPCDPRRFDECDILWAVDGTEGVTTSGLSAAETEGAIDAAMATWNNVNCSYIPLTKVDDLGYDLGYVQCLLGYGGVCDWLADYTHAGWLPRAFFDELDDDGGDYIIGVTFTFVWVDEEDNPTDVDHNGKQDVAFRETYYNDGFDWQIDATGANEVDVESIALHEAGHGLSQAHFGKIFGTWSNLRLHAAPRAVMNAVYLGMLQELAGTDIAGHCSIWATWPLH
jgi:hypothetical protein